MARSAAPPCTAASRSPWKRFEGSVAETETRYACDQAGSPASGAPQASGNATGIKPLPADAMIIMPVRNFVLFPGVVMPVTIGRAKSIAAAQQAVREQRQIGVLMQRDASVEDPSPVDMHRMGTVANIVRYVTAPDGGHHLICQGEQRFQILEFLGGWPFFVARVLGIPEATSRTPDIEARMLHLRGQAVEALELLPQPPQELIAAMQAVKAPGELADLTAAYMDIQPSEK